MTSIGIWNKISWQICTTKTLKYVLVHSKSFMPEQSGYFRIVENRGIVFIFLSKFLFYIFITLGMLKIVFGYFTAVPKNYISKILSNERTVIGKKFQSRSMIIYICTTILFLIMLSICLGTFYSASSNKDKFYTTGIKLKSLNTEMLVNMNEASVFILLLIELFKPSELRQASAQELC